LKLSFNKIFSARYMLAIMFGATACASTIMEIIPSEAFVALAVMVLKYYFDKKRKEEDGT